MRQHAQESGPAPPASAIQCAWYHTTDSVLIMNNVSLTIHGIMSSPSVILSGSLYYIYEVCKLHVAPRASYTCTEYMVYNQYVETCSTLVFNVAHFCCRVCPERSAGTPRSPGMQPPAPRCRGPCAQTERAPAPARRGCAPAS